MNLANEFHKRILGAIYIRSVRESVSFEDRKNFLRIIKPESKPCYAYTRVLIDSSSAPIADYYVFVHKVDELQIDIHDAFQVIV